MENIQVVDWIDHRESENYPENNAGGLGGWVDGHNFDEYLKMYDPDIHPYLIAIKEEVLAKNYRTTGEQHQHELYGIPLFSDGTISTFSYRAWGDLMAAIWNTGENTNKYDYMDFYM